MLLNKDKKQLKTAQKLIAAKLSQYERLTENLLSATKQDIQDGNLDCLFDYKQFYEPIKTLQAVCLEQNNSLVSAAIFVLIWNWKENEFQEWLDQSRAELIQMQQYIATTKLSER